MRPFLSLPPLALAFGVSPSEAANWRAEPMRIGDRRRQRGRRDDPDPRNGIKPPGQLVAAEPDHHLVLERIDPGLQFADLLRQADDDLARQRGNVRHFAVDKPIDQFQHVLNAPGQHDANSASWARIMSTSWVRWRTSRSRVRCSATTDCCSGDFIATNRIVGRVTASQIASASIASVLPRLT